MLLAEGSSKTVAIYQLPLQRTRPKRKNFDISECNLSKRITIGHLGRYCTYDIDSKTRRIAVACGIDDGSQKEVRVCIFDPVGTNLADWIIDERTQLAPGLISLKRIKFLPDGRTLALTSYGIVNTKGNHLTVLLNGLSKGIKHKRQIRSSRILYSSIEPLACWHDVHDGWPAAIEKHVVVLWNLESDMIDMIPIRDVKASTGIEDDDVLFRLKTMQLIPGGRSGRLVLLFRGWLLNAEIDTTHGLTRDPRTTELYIVDIDEKKTLVAPPELFDFTASNKAIVKFAGAHSRDIWAVFYLLYDDDRRFIKSARIAILSRTYEILYQTDQAIQTPSKDAPDFHLVKFFFTSNDDWLVLILGGSVLRQWKIEYP